MIVNFSSKQWNLTPEQALEFFVRKGLLVSFSWDDLKAAEHAGAFTIAKMTDLDLLKTVQKKLGKAIAEGKTLNEFKKELIPELKKSGWWGKNDVVDPKTGKVIKAQLGSAYRLETIFRTNKQAAYAAGRWDAIQASAATMPYLMYDAVDDDRTRHDHAARDGKVYRIDDPIWNTHFPPNGFNCRCGVIQLSDDDLRDMGLTVSDSADVEYRAWTNPKTGEVEQVPVDVDPGFAYNVGIAREERLKALYQTKRADMPPELLQKISAVSDKSVGKSALTDRERTKVIADTMSMIGETVRKLPDKGDAPDLGALSSAEASAIHQYSMKDVGWRINAPLRDNIGGISAMDDIRDIIDKALDKAEKRPGISYRGVSLSGDMRSVYLERLRHSMGSGEPWYDAAFTSTTTDYNKAYSGDIVLVIEGRNGVNIRSIADNPAEDEVLYKSRTGWEVDRIEEKDNKTFIYLLEYEGDDNG